MGKKTAVDEDRKIVLMMMIRQESRHQGTWRVKVIVAPHDGFLQLARRCAKAQRPYYFPERHEEELTVRNLYGDTGRN